MRWRELVLPAVVFGVLVAAAISMFTLTRNVIDDQERRLLRERAQEVATLLSTSMTNIEGPMRVLASLGGAQEQLDAGAGPLAPSEVAGVLTAVPAGEGFEIIAAVGDAPEPGTVLSDERAAVAARAVQEQDLIAARLVDDEEVSLFLAVAVDGTVVARETLVDPSVPVPAAPGTPYSELRMALYAGPAPQPDQLLLSTESDVPLDGHVLEVPLSMGADEWPLVVAAREPLVGGFAEDVPWVLLAGGLVAAGLATAVTVVLARRRSYAIAVVDERTRELRRAREVAEAANRSKSEFLSRMSHELRTPLNSVLGFGQILQMDDLDERQRDAVDHIRKGGEHLLQLVNEVLDISRAETGNLGLSPEAVRAHDMIDDSVALIGPLAEQRSVELRSPAAGGCDQHVFADRQRTQQILLNLLSNAVKYNRQRGTVTVACTTVDDRWMRVSVEDTGPGIPSDQLDRLFTPFDRLGAEQSGIEGTGMGLALSRSLAEAMGGHLEVTSVPGRGSTFWLDLPMVEEPVRRYERLSGHDPAEGAPSPEVTLLHVEDNLSNLNLVERIVSQRPEIEIIAAMQGRLGVELAHQHQPALVLLDLHLPDISGEEVLRELRDDPATSSIPVVIVSADATPGQIQRLQAAGAAAYLTKPIDVRELLQILDVHISR